jgi:hypothetical protein
MPPSAAVSDDGHRLVIWPLTPKESVTLRVPLYVPAVASVCGGLSLLAPEPSPNDHAHRALAAAPGSEASSNVSGVPATIVESSSPHPTSGPPVEAAHRRTPVSAGSCATSSSTSASVCSSRALGGDLARDVR